MPDTPNRSSETAIPNEAWEAPTQASSPIQASQPELPGLPQELSANTIATYGVTLTTLEAEMEVLEASLEAKKKQITQLTCILLPRLMTNAGVTEVKLTNGKTLKLHQIYQAKIPEEKKNAAFEYLDQSGNGSLIKNIIEVKYPRSGNDSAKQLIQFLESQGAAESFKHDQTVHPSTLKAFVAEQKKSGAMLKDDLLGVTEINIVTLK